MKTLLAGIIAGAILCAVCMAQEASPSQTNPAPQDQRNSPTTQSAQSSVAQQSTLRIAPGSIIPVQLTKTIDAKKVKTGDPVEAKVTQDLKTRNGEVVVPKDTRVLGHITEAQARSKEQTESEIGIAFDHAVVKDKGDVPLPMSIQAIIAAPTLNSNSNDNAGGYGAGGPAASPSPGPSQSNPGGMSGNNSGRSPGTEGGPQPQTQMPPPAGGSTRDTQAGAAAQQPITGNTQGVVGISNLKLAAAANPAQGSTVSSEKNNVKLEGGTLMLLRVNP